MRKYIFNLLVITATATASAQGILTLDSCRNMALANNKEIKVATLKIEQAGYQKKEASAAYKPSIDLEASYAYNQKNLSLVSEDQLLPVKAFNPLTQDYEFELLTNPATGQPVIVDGHPVPLKAALLPKSALTYNIHNVFAGALTITQPIYMGGKIKAMNEITRYAEDLARSMRNSKVEDVVYSVDAAYWQVVSLKAKQRLAESFVKLVESLDNDVKALVKEGVATRANQLSVDVARPHSRQQRTGALSHAPGTNLWHACKLTVQASRRGQGNTRRDNTATHKHQHEQCICPAQRLALAGAGNQDI